MSLLYFVFGFFICCFINSFQHVNKNKEKTKKREIGFSLSGTILESSLINSGKENSGRWLFQPERRRVLLSYTIKLASRVMYKTLII